MTRRGEVARTLGAAGTPRDRFAGICEKDAEAGSYEGDASERDDESQQHGCLLGSNGRT